MKNQYAAFAFVLTAFFVLFAQNVSAQESEIPDPELEFVEKREISEHGRRFTVFRLTVGNWEKFPEELFAPAPNLPPCGKNYNSSRTWVEIYNQKDKRIYGFCAIKSARELLNTLAFSVTEGENPPEKVYLVIFDREKKKFYKSKKISIGSNN